MDRAGSDAGHDRAPTPLTILTGFLGAGKSTLLNRILNGDHGLRVGVLVNDFGAINIDAELVTSVEGGVVSLANGCVCCQIRDDLVEAVDSLLARPVAIDYVLLEASGVADPAGILVTFNDEALRDRIRLDSITCIIDAEQLFAYADHPVLMRLKMMQIGCADITILNKVDLAGPAQIAKVRSWIAENFRRVRLVESVRCQVPLEILLGVGRYAMDGCRTPGHADAHICGAGDVEGPGHDHGATFSTWSFESDEPMSLAALREMVRRELPATVYRCKGIIRSAEQPDRRGILQVIGRRIDVSFGEAWGTTRPRTRIVAIGEAGGLNADDLRRQFESCRSVPETAV